MEKLTAARRDLLVRLVKHGTQFEREITDPKIGVALHAAGLVERAPASGGRRLITLKITDAGRALVKPDDECPCYDCRKEARDTVEEMRLRMRGIVAKHGL